MHRVVVKVVIPAIVSAGLTVLVGGGGLAWGTLVALTSSWWGTMLVVCGCFFLYVILGGLESNAK